MWPSASQGGRGSGPKPEEKLARKDHCFSSPLRVGIAGGHRLAKFTAVGSFHWELDQEAVFFFSDFSFKRELWALQSCREESVRSVKFLLPDFYTHLYCAMYTLHCFCGLDFPKLERSASFLHLYISFHPIHA